MFIDLFGIELSVWAVAACALISLVVGFFSMSGPTGAGTATSTSGYCGWEEFIAVFVITLAIAIFISAIPMMDVRFITALVAAIVSTAVVAFLVWYGTGDGAGAGFVFFIVGIPAYWFDLGHLLF